jgi:SAM-dependent methyltransferase
MTCRDNTELTPDQPVYWRERWEQGRTPWDCGCAHPLLVHLAPRLPAGRALVPGCGSGYDVIALAKEGPSRRVVGLDLSTLACKRGEALRDEAGLSPEQVQFIEDDFFTFDAGESFNLVYDYTFFCALPPSMRGQWADRMAQLVKPGGTLFTLMFPVRDSGTGAEGGPPFSVSQEAYASVLEPAGFTLLEGGEIAPEYRRPKTPAPGAELYGLWKRSSS